MDLDKLRIYVPDLKDSNDKKVHDQVVRLVEQIESGAGRSPRTPTDKEKLARRMSAAQAEIDALVYQLYGLTEAEISAAELQA